MTNSPYEQFKNHNFDLEPHHILNKNGIIKAKILLKEQRKLKSELSVLRGLKDSFTDTGISVCLAFALIGLNKAGLNPFESNIAFYISAIVMAGLAVKRLNEAIPKINRLKHLKSR